MEELSKIARRYQGIVEESEQKLKAVKQQIYRVGTLRLALFLAGVVGIIYFWWEGAPVIAGIAVVTFVPFLYLVKLHNRLFYKREYLETKIEVNHQELQALEHDFSSFGNGKAYVDPPHLYTYDLDVFGERSLFQYLNRTSTEMGEKLLASWLNHHLKDKGQIEERQEAVRELAPEIGMRQRFRILGMLYKGKFTDTEELGRWASTPNYYRSRRWMRLLPACVLVTNVVLIGLAVAGMVPSSLPGGIFVCFILASLAFTNNISKVQADYAKKLRILGTYARLIRIIEDQPMQAQALKLIQAKVHSESGTASKAVDRLDQLMNSLDQRNNAFVAALLNGLFFWELRKIMQIEGWKEEYGKHLAPWLEAIAETDAYCSLATFAYNHPDHIYPVIGLAPFHIQATALGHPLMKREKCVRNDINVEQQPFFLIITGANMAGKSTYLRTVGINYLLSCIGTPVWAEQMALYPAQLVTSLRTSDSLADDESYFFAELKRLKMIIGRLQAGEELFIILDEILKGTNSVDKQKGSLALVKQLITLQSNGVIATHDLLLGSLAEAFPQNIQNHCFEADITNGELTFSYTMREGIARNMNACFLMKKMGIAIIDDYSHSN